MGSGVISGGHSRFGLIASANRDADVLAIAHQQELRHLPHRERQPDQEEPEIGAEGDDLVTDVTTREGFAVVGLVGWSGKDSGHRPPRIPR